MKVFLHDLWSSSLPFKEYLDRKGRLDGDTSLTVEIDEDILLGGLEVLPLIHRSGKVVYPKKDPETEIDSTKEGISIERLWMVSARGEGDPTATYESLPLALQEAERLVLRTGKTVYVLEAVRTGETTYSLKVVQSARPSEVRFESLTD